MIANRQSDKSSTDLSADLKIVNKSQRLVAKVGDGLESTKGKYSYWQTY